MDRRFYFRGKLTPSQDLLYICQNPSDSLKILAWQTKLPTMKISLTILMNQGGIETREVLPESFIHADNIRQQAAIVIETHAELFVRKVKSLRKLTNKTYELRNSVFMNTDLRKMTWVTMRKSYLRTFLFVRKFYESRPRLVPSHGDVWTGFVSKDKTEHVNGWKWDDLTVVMLLCATFKNAIMSSSSSMTASSTPSSGRGWHFCVGHDENFGEQETSNWATPKNTWKLRKVKEYGDFLFYFFLFASCRFLNSLIC